MRILLVEDHIELSHWLSKALRDANLTIECATNGADADALLHTQDYGLVILDLTLPKMDGLDVLRRLRARGGARAKTWAPTTTWPSRSNWPNWKRASKRCCAAARATRRWCTTAARSASTPSRGCSVTTARRWR
jgi:hypothetical protein